MKTIKFLSLQHQHDSVRALAHDAFSKVYDEANFVLGNELKTFEDRYAAFSDSTYCLGVANGLEALILSLKACGISEGDEVIVPAHTYIATWLSVSHVGAKIIPVEPDQQTFNIDSLKIEERLTSRTKAIIPVHLYGQPCHMSSIESLAKKNNLLVIEDNAQAQGASWNGKKTGSWGDISATSFYPTKNLGALGDGGAITTSDKTKADFVIQYRNYGFEQKNVAAMKGMNSRLDELQASILKLKLQKLDAWNLERKRLAILYSNGLKNVGDIVTPITAKGADHVFHLYVVKTNYREPLRQHLIKHGVETMIHYPIPPYQQVAYDDLHFGKDEFPITTMLSRTVLSLPLYPGLKEEDVAYVCETIHGFFEHGIR